MRRVSANIIGLGMEQYSKLRHPKLRHLFIVEKIPLVVHQLEVALIQTQG